VTVRLDSGLGLDSIAVLEQEPSMPVESQMNANLPEILAARNVARQRARTASEGPSAAKVAEAWLEKQANTGYDHLVRCFLLEGAAGVRPRTWANQSARANLKKAEARLKSEHPNMDDAWFTTRDTGAWKVLENRVGKVFRQFGLDDDERQDVLHRALYGLTVDLSQGKIPLWEAAHSHLKDGMFEGRETPITVCAGLAGKWFHRKALSEAGTLKRRERQRGQELDVYEHGDRVEDPSQGGKPFGQVFIDIITDPGHPVGRKMRKFIWSTYQDVAPREKAIGDLFFGYFFRKGKFPSRTEVGHLLGMDIPKPGQKSDPTTLSRTNVWNALNKKILPRLGVEWRRRPKLQREVEEAVRALGGGDPEGSELESIFSPEDLMKFARIDKEVCAILHGPPPVR